MCVDGLCRIVLRRFLLQIGKQERILMFEFGITFYQLIFRKEYF